MRGEGLSPHRLIFDFHSKIKILKLELIRVEGNIIEFTNWIFILTLF